ncbi:MAG: hypothetical protein CSA22_02335 [Deltaproteobacteria bacterium]|nr:MAG: hypothetical protein CSA22_02335 [Deltaproteobacteria bacterium]
MFSNFILFILALLLFSAYHPPETLNVSLTELIAGILLTLLGHAVISRISFRRLAQGKKRDTDDRITLFQKDRQFQKRISRFSLTALVLYGVIVYGFHLPGQLDAIPGFSHLHTLGAAVSMAIFTLFMSLLWWAAAPAYQAIYDPTITPRTYIRSQFNFALPVLVPWFFLTLSLDGLSLVPTDILPGNPDPEILELICFILLLVVFIITAPLFIQRLWGCRSLAHGPVRDRIEATCRDAGIRWSDVLEWRIMGGSMVTAAVMGVIGRFRYILVTPGLLKQLTGSEIQAVIAHEAGHVRKKHLIFYACLLMGFSSLVAVFYPIFHTLFFTMTPLIWFSGFLDISITTFYSVYIAIVLMAGFVLYFRFGFGYFMRHFERQADGFAFTTLQTSGPLISTFTKIAAMSAHPPDAPNWHHFSISQRIAFLAACEQMPSNVARHDRQVRTHLIAAAIYLGVMLAGGVQLGRMDLHQKVALRWTKNAARYELSRHPDTPGLHCALADLYLDEGQYTEAIRLYRIAIDQTPNDSQALNNLAWALATCEDLSLRDPAEALLLARRSVDIHASAENLDTLAEALFLNGNVSAAIETEKKALQHSPVQRDHYEQQLEKFTSKKTGTRLP